MTCSTSGWPSWVPIACSRRMRLLKCTMAFSRPCQGTSVPGLAQRNGMQDVVSPLALYRSSLCSWFIVLYWLVSVCLPLSSVYKSSYQHYHSTTDSYVGEIAAPTPSEFPSVNPGVNGKVSAWLQQTHDPDSCAQGTALVYKVNPKCFRGCQSFLFCCTHVNHLASNCHKWRFMDNHGYLKAIRLLNSHH